MPGANSSQRERGRPREFELDVTIERAMDVFWSSGYHGTTLPELLAATGLSRGSLYGAFGDKHGLFLQALDRYIDASLTRLDAELGSGDSPIAGVRTCLEGYVERTIGSRGERGCLVVATAMELAGHDTVVEQRIAGFFRAMERLLAAALLRAHHNGELAAGVDATSGARLILCLVEGMRVVGKTKPERQASIAMIQTFLDRLTR